MIKKVQTLERLLVAISHFYVIFCKESVRIILQHGER